MLRITRIRLVFRGEIPADRADKVRELLDVYADRCPAYQSVKGCIDVSWTSELTTTGT